LGTTGTGGTSEVEVELREDENIRHLLFFGVTCFTFPSLSFPLSRLAVKLTVLGAANEGVDQLLVLLNSLANN